MKVQCCFCGEQIKGETPVVLDLQLPQRSAQTLYAHGECFKDKLHPSVPFLTPSEHEKS